jgi:hypothetical protein
MSVNTFVANRQVLRAEMADEDNRLAPLTAGFVILGLSVLGWLPLLLPIIALGHR